VLRAARCQVGLIAPEAGLLLVGGSPAEAQEYFRWDGPELRALLTRDDAAAAAAFAGYDAAIAYTANAELVAALRAAIPLVIDQLPSRIPPRNTAFEAFAEPALRLVAGPLATPPPILRRPEDEALAAPLRRLLPARFLAIHPGSGSPAKNWPAARFATLADRLAWGEPFLLVEGPADAEAVAEIRATSPRAVLAKGLPLRVLGALVAQASLYVGNDSGVSHLAAAFGAPTLALFGPTRAAEWRPCGPRVLALDAEEGALERLSVDEVERAARGALRSWERPGPP
jgi:ADP-heptose:LPS heptosyltransferase